MTTFTEIAARSANRMISLYQYQYLFIILFVSHLGPVVENFVSLTLSLISPQFVNYISTSKANTLLFLFGKM